MASGGGRIADAPQDAEDVVRVQAMGPVQEGLWERRITHKI